MSLINKKLLCLISTVFYAMYVVHTYLPFRYGNMLAGVDYNGYELFYATTIYLFAMVLFFGFGDTEKYIGGYGIMEVTRSARRKDIVRKVVIRQMINLLELVLFLCGSYLSVSALLGKRENHVKITELLLEMAAFYIVCLSLLLWQAIFEILIDSRIAIVIMMCVVGVHLYMGDFVIYKEWSKSLILIFYSNLALSIRSSQLDVSRWVMFVEMLCICLVQVVILNVVYKRKDIISA